MALANLFVWYVIVRENRGDQLIVAFLDVGQGDAIYIEAPNGNQVVLDGGMGRQILTQLGSLMPFYDRSIDLLIASHPDADHIGGLLDIFDRYQVGAFLEPGVPSSSGLYQTLQQKLQDQEIERILAQRGMRVVLAPEIYLTILFPDRDASEMEANEASIVARLDYGESSFLLTGDSPIKIEKYLIGLDSPSLSAKVLKAGHHGSKTSSSPEFVSAVDPDYAIISAGKDNRYGHPNESVLDILTSAEVKVLSTADQGNIIFRTNGQDEL